MIRLANIFLFTIVILSSCIFGLTKENKFDFEGIPSNPISGIIVFEEKGCIDCHSINSLSNKIGPDLGQEKVFRNFYDLASRLLNHSPEMVIKFKYLKRKWPTMNREELDKLISYVYFLRYLGNPGDVNRGEKIIRKNTCLRCHTIGKKKSPDRIPLDQLNEYASPLYIAQTIWNHGPKMQQRMKSRGITSPHFGNSDIADISAYLREYSRGQSLKKQYMSPGNPKTGFLLFSEKGCIKCHSTMNGNKLTGPPLSSLDFLNSVTGNAAKMLNHSNKMGLTMKKEKIGWPEFKGSELADLISFLYFFNYYGSSGDVKKGEEVFISKSCIRCHGPDSSLELDKSYSLNTPNELVRTMWNHVPYMYEVTITKNIQWPILTENDLRDLYAYILKMVSSK